MTARRRALHGGGDTEKYTVILIEPRKSMQKALEFVAENILANLPSSWNLIIFAGNENKADVQSYIETMEAKSRSRVTMKDLGLSSMDTAAYNALMMSDRILKEIPTEVFLVVQTDSLICKSGNKLLQKFIDKKYDYVGAPWKDRNALGNGGFSLRRKAMMLQVLEKCNKADHNEDGFFSGGCEGARPSKPSPEEAEEFSVETIYNGKQPFGIHKAWHHMPQNSKQLEEKCLGYSTLRGLNAQGGGGESPHIKSAVLTVFKNETMVLREWIEHYKWQGIDMMYLMNNDSTDDWQSITKDYPDFVTVVDKPGRHVQLGALNEGVNALKEQGVDVAVIVDIDEYMFGKDGKNLQAHIQEIFSKPDRPSSFNCGWSMFGSSGHKTQPQSIRESFTMRGNSKPATASGNLKTVVFLKDIPSVLSSQHIPTVTGKMESCPEGVQLNHYPIMSEEYFQKVKMTRGDVFVDAHNTVRDMDYFRRYNGNAYKNTTLADLVKSAPKSGGRRRTARKRSRRAASSYRRNNR